jgi:glutaredoxin 2
MIENSVGLHLHQKKFRGEQLTQQELEQLEAWYAEKDQKEAELLQVSAPTSTVNQLRNQISDILDQIARLTQQIQAISQENEKIRMENSRLFQLLAKKTKAA